MAASLPPVLRQRLQGVRAFAAAASTSQQGMQCNVAAASAATVLQWTGYGFAHDNSPLAPSGPDRVLVVGGCPGGAATRVRQPPQRLTAAGVYGIAIGGSCRVDTLTSYMTCGGSAQNDDAEQFAAFPAAATGWEAGQELASGSQIVLKSIKTGKWCRMVDVGGRQQVKCDQDSADGASALGLTPNGLSFQGQAFATDGAGTVHLAPPGTAGLPSSLKPGQLN
jgi:hypothetical protein